MSRKNAQVLLDKIDWEGGVMDAVIYGIRSKDVPAIVEDDWAELEKWIDEIEKLEAQIMAALTLEAEDGEAFDSRISDPEWADGDEEDDD